MAQISRAEVFSLTVRKNSGCIHITNWRWSLCCANPKLCQVLHDIMQVGLS